MAFRLPRLPQTEPSWPQMQVWWQQVVEAIQTQEAGQDELLAQIIAAQADADAALTAASASMPEIAPVNIPADYTGTIDSALLPRLIYAQRFDGATDVTTAASWSFTTDSGSLTASIGASTGILEVTALDSSSVVTITSVHNGVTLSRKAIINKTVAGAPSTGGSGGGTVSSDSDLSIFFDSIAAPVSDELTVTVGTSGNVQLSAPLSVYTDDAAPYGSFPVLGSWEWWDGASWIIQGGEVSSSPHCSVSASTGLHEGTLTVSYLATGFAAASSQKFRLVARNAVGTRTMFLTGTASAVAE